MPNNTENQNLFRTARASCRENFVITVTESDEGFETDKSIDEINAAFIAGKEMMLRFDRGGGTDTYFPLASVSYKDNGDCSYFFDATVSQADNLSDLTVMRFHIGIDGVFMRDGQATGGNVGVQSDWNQNDDTQPDYVKNRPFYTGDPVETVLVEESTVSFTESVGKYETAFPSTVEATVGETYSVSWDGTAYECACVDYDGGPSIGNLSIDEAGSDTGEPFLINIYNGEAVQILTTDTSASHTFSISHYFAGEVVKIDKKYLPKVAFITYDSSTSTYSSDFTNDELYERMLEGEQIVLYFPTDNARYYLTMWKKKSDGSVDLSFAANAYYISLLPDGTIVANDL